MVPVDPAPVPYPGSAEPASTLDVLFSLTASDLRARYGQGAPRMLKWLLDPYATLGVYLLLVAVFLDRPGRAVGLSLACAIVPFQFLMSTVTNALDGVRIRQSIIANMDFPRVLIPVVSVVTEAVAFSASLTLVVVMMVVYGVSPTGALAFLPAVLLVTLVLAAALAYPASLAGVWFPQLRQILTSFVRALFFLAPGIVALDQIHGTAHELVKLNPLTAVFEGYRSVLLDGSAPDAWMLFVPMGAAGLLLAVVVPLYRRDQRHFAKVV
jgi:homopolymeric O-antigen transport system permease protein